VEEQLLQKKTMSEAEFIKQASEAWEEAIKIAESTTGWKEEKNDKKTGFLSFSAGGEIWWHLEYFLLLGACSLQPLFPGHGVDVPMVRRTGGHHVPLARVPGLQVSPV